VLLAGSLLVYPLALMLSDTLIGLGKIQSVLVANVAWTTIVVLALWLLTPIGREVSVALVWLVGVPFFLIYVVLYQRSTHTQLKMGFLPKTVVVLAIVALLAFGMLWVGSYLMVAGNLVGLVGWLFQIGLVLTIIPLAVVYLWMLIRSQVFDAGDRLALLRMSEVLHPVSRPISWLVERMSSRDDGIDG
jgi:hypothetical protein